ncbi:somatolactin beta [Megalops cyprinoides]|uniref:somatolactin beta n=1 Tax=Megalops cyprinoides TaxID=118141 RepID=UPI001863E555|nr:somatolactin beta [Megalops cyprinoides]
MLPSNQPIGCRPEVRQVEVSDKAVITSNRMNKVRQGCIWLLLWSCQETLGYPTDCRDRQDTNMRCPSISLDKLLDRIIQHAELIYRVSEESCTLFEDMFIPYTIRSQMNRGGNVCTTKSIPGSKSEIQQNSDKWLLHSALILIQSWIEPLNNLQTTLDRYDNAPDTLLNKTKWVSNKLINLEQGVVVLIRKMLDEGILISEPNQSLAYHVEQPDMMESVLTDYALLTCFKKDAHKVETFLKLLKCRQTDRLSCFLL